MKNFRALVSLLALGASLRAQDAAPALPAIPTNPDGTAPAPSGVRRTNEELEQLVAPIALYPDALIAIILPASTVPTDIVLAARYVRDNPGDRTQIEHRGWDDSVKSLTNYPDVLKWMDENLQWTQQIGEAFAQQPAEVMESIQRLRARARTAGTLVDTPQQQVISEAQVIRIVPAQPDIIYVPSYEPDIVFVDRPVYYGRPFLSFGFGVPVGAWLAFDCDWHRHTIWVGNRHRHWVGHDWRQPVVPIGPAYTGTRTPEVRQWRPPPPTTTRVNVAYTQPYRAGIVRPTPFGFDNPQPTGFASRNPAVVNAHHDSNGYRTAQPVATPQAVLPQTQPQEQTSQQTPSVPRGYRRDYAGPRAAPTVTPPPQNTAVNNPTPTPTAVPNIQPLPTARRGGPDGSHDNATQARGPRSAPAVTTAPLPTVSPLPMSAPPQSAPVVGPMPQQRSYSRPAVATPSGPPSMPATNRSVQAPANVLPAAPPPAVVQPAQPAQAAQAAPQHSGGSQAQAQRSGSVGRGGREDAVVR